MSSALITVGNSAGQILVGEWASPMSRSESFLHHLSFKYSIMVLLDTHPYQTLAALFFGCILFRQLNKLRSGNPKGLPLPPGPKGYPLIGSLFDMPIDKPWLVYDEWRKSYGRSLKIVLLRTWMFNSFFTGDMIYFNVLGQHFLILSSLERTTDLFEKKSSNYSDRPRAPMLVDLYVSDSLVHLKAVKRKLVSEWDGISTSAFCPTVCCGEDTGGHFISISTLTRCPNTSLFKDERSMHFYIDC